MDPSNVKEEIITFVKLCSIIQYIQRWDMDGLKIHVSHIKWFIHWLQWLKQKRYQAKVLPASTAASNGIDLMSLILLHTWLYKFLFSSCRERNEISVIDKFSPSQYISGFPASTLSFILSIGQCPTLDPNQRRQFWGDCLPLLGNIIISCPEGTDM